MKNFLALLALPFSAALFAQIPAGYYDTATGTGYTLKTELHNIIDDHTDQGYSGLYVTYTTSDVDLYYENDGTLLDMYSENPTGEDAYEYTYGSDAQDDGSGGTSEGQKFNREHVIPQSYFNSEAPMHNDAHFIVPTDKYVNAQRSNLPYGKVATANYTSTNGSKRGNNLNSGYSAGYSSTVFEPIDEFKGDIARMFFYFATRYEDQLADFYTQTDASSTQAKAMFDGTEGHSFSPTFLNILLTWNSQDPVSQREIDRNNAIYNRQNNRNPFIDHPEYVAEIWGTTTGTENYQAIKISVYPNPATNGEVNLSTDANINEIQLISINGQLIQDIKNPLPVNHTYTLTGLSKGFYFVKAISADKTSTNKIIVK